MAQTAASPTDRLRERYPELMEGFVALRSKCSSGPLDRKTQELIMVAILSTGRMPHGVRTHTRRALEAGASPEEVRQAVLLTLAASLGISAVGEAMDSVNEAIAATGR